VARNIILFHYDGPIAENHQITVRTLGNTLSHLQSAIDRAYIDLTYGAVAKHARLKSQDYALTDFKVGQPADGGYILDLINAGPLKIVDRVNAALSRAFNEAANEALPFAESLVQQAAHRTEAVERGAQVPVDLAQRVPAADQNGQRVRYADRAINRELDQVLAQIRIDRYGGSTLDLQLTGDRAHPIYSFNRDRAERFHQVVAARTLGAPVRLTVKLRALDGGTQASHPVGKAIHVDTGKAFVLHFKSAEDFNSVVPFMRANNRPPVSIVACPVLEYGVFDPDAGDMFFIRLNQ
jgi:hypothetical protein